MFWENIGRKRPKSTEPIIDGCDDDCGGDVVDYDDDNDCGSNGDGGEANVVMMVITTIITTTITMAMVFKITISSLRAYFQFDWVDDLNNEQLYLNWTCWRSTAVSVPRKVTLFKNNALAMHATTRLH